MTGQHKYRVAGMCIEVVATSELWQRVEHCYAPFACDNADPALHVTVDDGPLVPIQDVCGDSQLLYDGMGEPWDTTRMVMYGDAVGTLVFDLVPPFSDIVSSRLVIDADYRYAAVTIDQALGHRATAITATLTSAMQLAYLLAATGHSILMAHSSCVVYQGRAYLFLGKSGTGKSTHSRMWLENIPGTWLLNDDHPIIGWDSEGTATAYGSPWSGKTPCYKNCQAPIGAIVRIKRAPHNAIHRLSPLRAFASLTTSMSGISWIEPLSLARHAALERLIGDVPCYELECLPDADAARVCMTEVSQSTI